MMRILVLLLACQGVLSGFAGAATPPPKSEGPRPALAPIGEVTKHPVDPYALDRAYWSLDWTQLK